MSQDLRNPLDVVSEFISVKQTPQWIIKESSLPWLELDLQAPYEKLYNEIVSQKDKLIEFCSNIPKDAISAQCRARESKRHNVTHCVDKWKFITLWGVDSHIVDNVYNYPELAGKENKHKWTDVGLACPEHVKFIEENFKLDDDITIKYAVLEPGGFLTPHSDALDLSNPNYELSSLTLMTHNPKECNFFFETFGELPISNGRLYLLDVDYYHATWNRSNENRYHLMFLNNREKNTFLDYFKDNTLVQRSYEKSLANFKANVS